ncbi:hypothetical protein HBB16_03015 [Pseudonocardia sp. MCCB 268]|nr:hypothetical protein [Pseudonocardia cytotoxica]
MSMVDVRGRVGGPLELIPGISFAVNFAICGRSGSTSTTPELAPPVWCPRCSSSSGPPT